MIKRTIFSAVCLALAFTVSSAFANTQKLRIGVEAAYPPFSQKEADGTLVGFDIDIAYALCKVMKAECTLVEQDWDGMIPALMVKKFDAIIASMSITEERMKKIDFSEKYYNIPAKFVAKKGVNWADTNEGLKGKVVGVQRGTTHHNYMMAHYPDVKLKLYSSQDEVYLDMASGRLDAMLAGSTALNDGFLKQDMGKGFAFFGGDHTDIKHYGPGVGVAVRKNEHKLRDDFSKAIKTIRANGVYKKINDKYFANDIYGD